MAVSDDRHYLLEGKTLLAYIHVLRPEEVIETEASALNPEWRL